MGRGGGHVASHLFPQKFVVSSTHIGQLLLLQNVSGAVYAPPLTRLPFCPLVLLACLPPAPSLGFLGASCVTQLGHLPYSILGRQAT